MESGGKYSGGQRLLYGHVKEGDMDLWRIYK
jgi:hypothetical protein